MLTLRLSRCVEKLEHKGVLASSGRAQGLALLTQCPTALHTLSRWRLRDMHLWEKQPGGIAEDQMAIEATLGFVGERKVYGRLQGLHQLEGGVLRELAMHEASYRLPERWVRLFLRDYTEVPSRSPWGVMLFDEKSERPPMDTADELCGQAVSLRRVENLVVLEPAVASDGARYEPW